MDSAILQEEILLIKNAKNDPEAFGELYDRYYPQIFRFVLTRTGNYELAQDLTAETFFQALKSIWRFRLRNKTPFSSWLYKIAIAQISNFYRKKSSYCELSMEECPEIINRPDSASTENSADYVFDKNLEFQEIFKLLQKLKPIHQNILTLRYFEEKTFEEISVILGMKINTAKSHHRRALNGLREIIKESNHSLTSIFHERRIEKNSAASQGNQSTA